MSTKLSIDKSFNFAIRIINMCKVLREQHNEYVMSKQILRSGTSIGANLKEGAYAQSKLDFIHKNHIALKECSETSYWLELLYRTNYLEKAQYESMDNDCKELLKILIAIIKTAKGRMDVKE